MAAPTPKVRATPSGTRPQTDGHQTLITLSSDDNIEFWEVTVTPFGFRGGEKVPLGNMHNVNVRTFGPPSLYELTDIRFRCTFDPAVLNSIKAAINRNDTITVHMPDHSTWAAYGYLNEFNPLEHREQGAREAEGVIVLTNQDPSDGSEAEPVYTAGGGTGA